jgi:hypothetical protein
MVEEEELAKLDAMLRRWESDPSNAAGAAAVLRGWRELPEVRADQRQRIDAMLAAYDRRREDRVFVPGACFWG